MKSTWFLLSFVWKDWLLWLNINRWIWNGFALYVLIVDRIIGRNIGPLFTSTTLVVVAATSAIFLPYHSFIDSRLSKSITIFLVKKTNGVNESKESNTSYWQSMIHPFMNVWKIINGINKKKCVYCNIGCCRIWEKDGVMIHVRWQCKVIIKWFEMIECGSSKSSIHYQFWRMEFLWSLFWWNW